jgi:hypothetical protein
VEHGAGQHGGDSSFDLDSFVLAHKKASASRHGWVSDVCSPRKEQAILRQNSPRQLERSKTPQQSGSVRYCESTAEPRQGPISAASKAPFDKEEVCSDFRHQKNTCHLPSLD